MKLSADGTVGTVNVPFNFTFLYKIVHSTWPDSVLCGIQDNLITDNDDDIIMMMMMMMMHWI